MTAVRTGRWTDDHDGPLVVFVIGMTVNSWWRLRRWWPVAAAMPRMLRELAADPGAGLLGWTMALGSRGPVLVQYWSSTEQLLAYAHDVDGQHRPAWAAYNAMVRQAGPVVGVWHETYQVPAGGHESVYVNTPALGLGACVGHVPVARRGDGAGQRLSGGEPLSPPAAGPR